MAKMTEYQRVYYKKRHVENPEERKARNDYYNAVRGLKKLLPKIDRYIKIILK